MWVNGGGANVKGQTSVGKAQKVGACTVTYGCSSESREPANNGATYRVTGQHTGVMSCSHVLEDSKPD